MAQTRNAPKPREWSALRHHLRQRCERQGGGLRRERFRWEHVLYSFAGAGPEAGLLAVNGVLYGTTQFAGLECGSSGSSGCGSVFRSSP